MSLTPGCPRCATPIARAGDGWSCPGHGVVPALWRPPEASYDAFAAVRYFAEAVFTCSRVMASIRSGNDSKSRQDPTVSK